MHAWRPELSTHSATSQEIMNMGESRPPEQGRVTIVAGRAIGQPDRVLRACQAIASRYADTFMAILYPDENTPAAGEEGEGLPDAGGAIRLPWQELGQKTLINRYNEYFSRRLQSILRPVGGDSAGATVDAEDGLALLEETELEETLAVTNLVEKLSQRFSDELYCMEERFSHLCPDAAFSLEGAPFGPENLCRAFHDLLESMGLDLEMSLYQLKRLDKVLMKTVREYFHEINAHLIAEGILPGLRHKVVKREEPVAQGAAAGAEHVGLGGEAAVPPVTREPPPIQPDARMYQAIQQLLALGDAAQPPRGQDGGEAPAFSITPRLLDSLTQLQEGQISPARGAGPAAASLREQVNAVLASNSAGALGGRLNQIDNDTIDVISMIFDLILDDRSLPDSVKALIGRLQIPILKAAIIDRNFFRHKNHPARRLINKLAYAGVGWSEDCEATQDRLYKKMEAVVTRIQEEFDSDLHIFEELLSEFEAFIEQERRAFEQAREKIRQEALARERKEHKKKEIVARIMEKHRADPVPGEILEFLVSDWSRVVAEASQCADGDGPGYERAVQFVEDLMWSLAPKTSQAQRKDLLRVLPGILKLMTEGLEWIGYEAERTRDLMASLERHHVTLLKGPGTESPARQQAPPAVSQQPPSPAPGEQSIDREIAELNSEIDLLPDLDGDAYELFDEMQRESTSGDDERFEKLMNEMGLTREEDPGPRIDDEYTELVKGLALGSWVELSDDQGGRMRVKLAWRGDQFTNFSFVNRHYKVVAERPFYVLADDFRQGRAVQVDAPELFDRALDGVISGIMRVVN